MRDERVYYGSRYVHKQQYMRNRRTVYIIFSILILLCIVCFITGFSKVEKKESNHQKYYTSVEIQEGDSLWSIAKSNMTEEYSSEQEYINEVKEMNHLTNNQITKGRHIVIPHYTID